MPTGMPVYEREETLMWLLWIAVGVWLAAVASIATIIATKGPDR